MGVKPEVFTLLRSGSFHVGLTFRFLLLDTKILFFYTHLTQKRNPDIHELMEFLSICKKNVVP